jgi:hypothetical protein
MAISKMIERGWLQEVDASSSRNVPLWRETGDGNGTTLVVTGAGLLAIGIEPVVVKAVARARKETVAAVADTPKPIAIRTGTRQAQIIALLQRPEGTTIAEIVAVSGWMSHTARGLISGVLKKKLGLAITATKEDGRGTVYQVG